MGVFIILLGLYNVMPRWFPINPFSDVTLANNIIIGGEPLPFWSAVPLIIVGISQIIFGILLFSPGYRLKNSLGISYGAFMTVMAIDLTFTLYLITQRSIVLNNLTDLVSLFLTVLAPIIGIVISITSMVYFTIKFSQKNTLAMGD